MSTEIVRFRSKETRTSQDVGTFLRELADKLDAGQIILRQGNEELVLDLPGELVLEIKVEDEEKRSKGTQHSLEVELKWYDGATATGGVQLG